jgi:uncharacterized membrane protein YdjX (TVP38/TMEM64 family)
MTGRRIAKLALLLVLVGAVVAIYFSPFRDHLTRQEVRATVGHLRGYWHGPLIFMALYAVGSIFAIPASLFVIAAGLIWGWMWGGTYAMAGGLMGAVASFLAGRFIGEGLLERFGRVGRAVTRQVDHAGFKSLLILRFIPGIPFAVLNYGAGVAGVRMIDFILATIVGMAPSVYVFAYCSDALFNGTMSEGDALRRLLIVAVLMISLAVIPAVLKRKLRSQIEVEQGSDRS